MTDDGKDKGQDKGQDADASDKGEKTDQKKTDQNMIPKTRFDQVNEARKSAEAELKSVADELKADIPEDFQDLIPDLPPAGLIKWIRNATAKGLFDPKGSNDSPDSKRPDKKKETPDFEGMTPQAIMSTGYGKK